MTGLAWAQDRVPKDDTEKYARLCVTALAAAGEGPLATEGDPARAIAVRGEGGGAMILPDQRLVAEKLKKAAKDVVPVGQLWLRKWVPASDEKPVAADRLRVVTVRADGADRPMPVLLLGVRAAGENRLELVVYAKEVAPLMVLPLTNVEFVQEQPIDMTWERGEKRIDRLTLTLIGRHRAVLPVTRQ